MAFKGKFATFKKGLKHQNLKASSGSRGGIDGNGTFHRKWRWVEEMLKDSTIDAEPMDDEFDNYAEAMNQYVTRDSRGHITADFNFAGNQGINLAETFDLRQGHLATVNQLIKDPSRIFVDIGTDGEVVVLRNKYSDAQLVPNQSYQDGYWFIFELHTRPHDDIFSIRFENNAGVTLGYPVVNYQDIRVRGKQLKAGGVYLVVIRNEKFYFLNFHFTDDPYVTSIQGALDVEYFDSAIPRVEAVFSYDFEVITEGMDAVQIVRSDFLLIDDSGDTASSGIQQIISPLGTLFIDDGDESYIKMEVLQTFLSSDMSVSFDYTDRSEPDMSVIFPDTEYVSGDSTVTTAVTSFGTGDRSKRVDIKSKAPQAENNTVVCTKGSDGITRIKRSPLVFTGKSISTEADSTDLNKWNSEVVVRSTDNFVNLAIDNEGLNITAGSDVDMSVYITTQYGQQNEAQQYVPILKMDGRVGGMVNLKGQFYMSTNPPNGSTYTVGGFLDYYFKVGSDKRTSYAQGSATNFRGDASVGVLSEPFLYQKSREGSGYLALSLGRNDPSSTLVWDIDVSVALFGDAAFPAWKKGYLSLPTIGCVGNGYFDEGGYLIPVTASVGRLVGF